MLRCFFFFISQIGFGDLDPPYLRQRLCSFKPTICSHAESTICSLNGCSNKILCQKQIIIVSGPFIFYTLPNFGHFRTLTRGYGIMLLQYVKGSFYVDVFLLTKYSFFLCMRNFMWPKKCKLPNMPVLPAAIDGLIWDCGTLVCESDTSSPIRKSRGTSPSFMLLIYQLSQKTRESL